MHAEIYPFLYEFPVECKFSRYSLVSGFLDFIGIYLYTPLHLYIINSGLFRPFSRMATDLLILFIFQRTDFLSLFFFFGSLFH
jgi:hypothetical protein